MKLSRRSGLITAAAAAVVLATSTVAQTAHPPAGSESAASGTGTSSVPAKPPASPLPTEPETEGIEGNIGTEANPLAPAQGGAPQQAGANSQGLAKELANPLASLVSVPFQHNFDFGLGPNRDGFRYTMNFQPVIPIALNAEWNLISRTIVPIIHQSDVVPGTSQTGLGDTLQSFFFSPTKIEPFIWGVGPVMLIPTGTNDSFGTRKFGLGFTVVALKQKQGWTVGALMNHVWSVAGNENRPKVSSTFLQPFLAYTTKTAWTFTLNTESTYDWTGEAWSVPLNLTAAKLLRFGKLPVSLGGGLRCWATSPAGGAHGCGFRIITTLLFPKIPKKPKPRK